MGRPHHYPLARLLGAGLALQLLSRERRTIASIRTVLYRAEHLYQTSGSDIADAARVTLHRWERRATGSSEWI